MKRVFLLLASLTGCAGHHELAQCGSSSGRLPIAEHLHVLDDGQSTFIRIPGNARIPVVYVVGSGGTEELANASVFEEAGDHVIQLHQTVHEIRLRDGDAIACLTNNAWSPEGKNLGTGTTSPNVRRVLKENPS